MSTLPPVKKSYTYANELECSDENTRLFVHPCVHKGSGKLADVPPILQGTEEEPVIPNMMKRAAEKFQNEPCMGTRDIEVCTIEGKKQFWRKGDIKYKTYQQVFSDVEKIAKSLIGLPGVKELRESNKCVAAILAETSAEWQMSAQASFKLGIPITTVYTTLGHEAMCHGLNETESAILFLDWAQYHALKTPVLSKCPHIKHIVLIGECWVAKETVGGESKAFPIGGGQGFLDLAVANAAVTTLPALIKNGEGDSNTSLAQYLPKPNDLAFIMYTSGSTGLPKGVMLTQANFVALIASTLFQDTLTPTIGDVYIAYLPLAHILELMVETVCLVQGAAIGYSHARSLTASSPYIKPGDLKSADLTEIRPTVMVAVPAVLEVIKNGLMAKLASMPGLSGGLARSAVAKAASLPSSECCCCNCLISLGLKNKVLLKVKKGLGVERVRIIASGGAPLAAQTQEFIRGVIAPVAQGYGATETTGCTTVQECLASGGRPADTSSGGVGAIVPAATVKLRSVPDMGYSVTDDPPRGEILVGGNTVAMGYFKMEEKTAEDFPMHSDGQRWFHTGDIGELSETGVLKIIDRKKDLIKLSGGEYVSLGKVENALKQVKGIGAVCVFAQSDKDYCVAIVSEPERGWNSVGGKPEEAQLLKDIDSKLKELGHPRFEIPTKVKLDDTVWTPESGLVTASMKLQRNPLREYYNVSGGLLAQMGYSFVVG
jgi:long-chain acyl-CoA synthetase